MVQKTKYDMLVELLTDWENGGRLDLIIDAIKAVTDALPDAGALNDLAAILLDTGTTIPGTITTLQTAVTGIQNDLDNATDGLGALKALIDAVQADATAILLDTGTTIPGTITTLQTAVTGIQNDLDNATDGLGALKALIDAAQADITAIKAVTDLLPDGGALNDLAAILTDTGTTIPGTITTLQTAVTGIQNDLDNATDGLGALKALIDNLDADLVAHEASQATHRTVLVDIHDTDLPAVKAETALIKTQTDKIAGKMLFPMIKWSEGKVQVQIDAAGATITLPTITIANLPTTATIVEAYLMFKFRMIENEYAGVNKLNGATVAATSQVMQIQDDGGGAWTDAINFVDDFFTLADGVREGGDVIVGTLNVGVANVVDGNDTYNVRFLLGKADQDFINFDDVQVGLQIWYSL